MTADELRAILARKGISVSAASDLIGVERRTVQKWLIGIARISAAATILFRLLDKGKISRRDIEKARGGETGHHAREFSRPPHPPSARP
jgi:transcriptional regulator with XRE-family HTH domain